MNEQENTRVVQALFAAFDRGDFQSCLKLLAEDVEWQSPVTRTVRHGEIVSHRHTADVLAAFRNGPG